MEQLKIPERTFQRYYSQAFIAERQLLAKKLTDEEVLNQLAVLEARLSKQRRQLLTTIANDNKVDPRARVNAHHAAGVMATVVFKIYSEAVVEILKDRASRFSSDRKDAKEAFDREYNPEPYMGNYRKVMKPRGYKKLPFSPEKWEQERELSERDKLEQAAAGGYDELDYAIKAETEEEKEVEQNLMNSTELQKTPSQKKKMMNNNYNNRFPQGLTLQQELARAIECPYCGILVFWNTRCIFRRTGKPMLCYLFLLLFKQRVGGYCCLLLLWFFSFSSFLRCCCFSSSIISSSICCCQCLHWRRRVLSRSSR
jgi:hypothetical protein